MAAPVDLVWLGNLSDQPPWSLGEVRSVEASPVAMHCLMKEHLPVGGDRAWLFWDRSLGAPQEESVLQALQTPGDIWHAGLRLGVGGLPQLIDFVSPGWMLNRDPPVEIIATSWRCTLRCCLARTTVLEQMRGIHPEFLTLEAAALEWGHRCIRQGVLIRHVPWLAPEEVVYTDPPQIPLEDELRFIYYCYGRRWSKWALWRGWLAHYFTLGQATQAWKKVSSGPLPAIPGPFAHRFSPLPGDKPDHKVSVLIPTLDRYPYLRTLLSQLERQTIRPFEIIVVDQTRSENRYLNLAQDFPNLPIKMIYQDQPGQCSSRNAGLQMARGEFILFIDDDDEVQPDLIEGQLRSILESGADVSSGVAEEVGAGPLPPDFTYMRLSNVFPTNNTLIYRRLLKKSGLFDMAYNRLARADADLGMRLYLSGAYMLLNPRISVLHHHAPAGGLRAHKARVITYAGSRQSLTQRQLPSRSEIYLAKRYFTPRQVRETLWLRALGTFSVRGGKLRQAMKIVVGALLFPHTWWQIRTQERQAEEMLKIYPQIPRLDDRETSAAEVNAQ